MDFPSALAILASPGGHAVPRAEAESIVQAVVNDPSRGIQALCHALECDGRDDLGTRRLAAVLLSTAAARHWSVLGDDAKAAMRQRTLAALSRAEDRAEMRALVHAADTLASRSADDGSPWHELLPALDDAAKSARATHREAAVILLGSIVESTGAHMNDHHAALVALFAARLDDPVREVAAAATRALGTTALALQRRGDFLVVADLLPRILAACVDAAARRLDRSDDEAVAVATDAIAAAASVDCDVAFGSDASLLPRVVDVLVGIGTDPRMHPDGRARAAAFDALGCLAASHPGLLDEPRPTAAGRGTGTAGTAVTAPTTTLADEIVPRLCAAAAAAGVDFTAAGRAEGEAESGGFAAAARSTLRRFSLHLPPAVVLPHVVAPLDAALLAGAAPSPGALACLAAVTEGCASDLAEDPIASNVIASVAAAMESPDPGSKVAAVVAFKELAEHAGHALTELYSHAVIPTLVAAIRLAVEHETEGGRGDAAESFVAPAHAAAGALCANFGSDEIAPALPGVIPPLLGGALGGWRRGEDGARGIRPRGMDRAPRTNPRARARCLDTLERFARAAAFEFEPFASDVVATLATLATTNGGGGGTDDRDDDASHAGRVDREGVAAVRFRSLAAMATVIAAVGEESAPRAPWTRSSPRRLSRCRRVPPRTPSRGSARFGVSGDWRRCWSDRWRRGSAGRSRRRRRRSRRLKLEADFNRRFRRATRASPSPPRRRSAPSSTRAGSRRDLTSRSRWRRWDAPRARRRRPSRFESRPRVRSSFRFDPSRRPTTAAGGAGTGTKSRHPGTGTGTKSRHPGTGTTPPPAAARGISPRRLSRCSRGW